MHIARALPWAGEAWFAIAFLRDVGNPCGYLTNLYLRAPDKRMNSGFLFDKFSKNWSSSTQGSEVLPCGRVSPRKVNFTTSYTYSIRTKIPQLGEAASRPVIHGLDVWPVIWASSLVNTNHVRSAHSLEGILNNIFPWAPYPFFQLRRGHNSPSPLPLTSAIPVVILQIIHSASGMGLFAGTIEIEQWFSPR